MHVGHPANPQHSRSRLRSLPDEGRQAEDGQQPVEGVRGEGLLRRPASATSFRFTIGAAVVVGVVAALFAWLRVPAADRGVVWAEDGRIFLQQRIALGFGGSILHPYEGYLQFAPRLLTQLALILSPLSHYAMTVSVLTCLTAGLIATAVFLASRDVVSSVGIRICLGLITVLGPTLTNEVLGNMANIHGLFLWLTPWLLLFRPAKWWQSWLIAALVLACELTEIQAVIFLPLAILAIRHRKSWPVGIALVVGTAMQAAASIIAPRQPSNHPFPSILDTLQGFVANVLVAGLTGRRATTVALLNGFGMAECALLFGIPVAAALVVVALRSTRRDYVLVLALAAGITVPWVASVLANAGPNVYYSHLTNYAGFRILRYGAVPSLFIMALGVIAGDKLLAVRQLPGRFVGVVLVIAVVLVGALGFQSDETRRTGGPNWTNAYAHAVVGCKRGATVGVIPTSPVVPHSTTFWAAQLPCAVILSR